MGLEAETPANMEGNVKIYSRFIIICETGK